MSTIRDLLSQWEIHDMLVQARELRDGDRRDLYTWGLCGVLAQGLTDANFLRKDEVFIELYGDWPEHSGDEEFPVPAPEGTLLGQYESKEQAAYMRTDNMYEGEYGAARLRLLDHVITKLEAAL